MSEHELNARGLLCPLPVIKTQNQAKTLNSGDTLTVYCTDPGTKQDIPSWCRMYGHEVLSINESETELYFVIEIQ